MWQRSVTADEAAVILAREGFEPTEIRQVIGQFCEELELRHRLDDAHDPQGEVTEDDLGQLRARLNL
ncbi:hypothetical protein ABZ942_42305 [Nocardia sp. NPDC046473]|uniref:hypothetical protein n=1 Tax=Nocardia sp. NPDC046473 TaxID=3155733 RepID=UPI0033CDB83F